jgi:CubicO group peptidase (beta-lactamase class C family)
MKQTFTNMLKTFSIIVAIVHSCASSTAAEPASSSTPIPDEVRDLNSLLQPILDKHKIPALAAAFVKHDKTVGVGAVGVRRRGYKEPVTVDDKFHIGSCTKAMTATLCALLVQQGKLKWESTVSEVFSDQADKIHADLRGVTLEQLLSHRSGLPEDRSPLAILPTWLQVRALSGPLRNQRRKLVEIVLSQKPAAAPGSKFQYSNLGYTLAGAMCERVTGKSYEELMQAELFEPLGMASAGFGPPGNNKGKGADQPQGHSSLLGILTPVAPGPGADNPAVIAPAGTVHASVGDWVKFGALHVRGAKGNEPRLPADVFRKLHTSAGDDYAFGWGIAERGWAGGKALVHTGSNGTWFADIWLAPEKDMGFVAATNLANEAAMKACDEAISAMIKMAASK